MATHDVCIVCPVLGQFLIYDSTHPWIFVELFEEFIFVFLPLCILTEQYDCVSVACEVVLYVRTML